MATYVQSELWFDFLLEDHDAVIALLKSGKIDPKSDIDDCFGLHGETPLHYACRYGWLDVVKLLITRYNCDATIEDEYFNTPLSDAYSKTHKQITQYLIAHLVDNEKFVPKDGEIKGLISTLTELNFLSTNEMETNQMNLCLNISKCLLRVTTNLQKSHQQLLLFLICRYGWMGCLMTFISQYKYCDLEPRDIRERTPLHYASRHGHCNVVMHLVSRGCNANVIDINKQSLLHAACCSSNVKLVKYLVKSAKCDPWQVDNKGNTALHLACEHNVLDTVRYLLSDTNSNITTRNANGETPIKLTTSLEINKELIRHGVTPADVYKNHGKVVGTKRPLTPPVKIFVVGNPFAGKSTLVAALQNEVYVVMFSKKITRVDERTAGVIPHDFKSKRYGWTILYDFAGQKEFYGSHAALLQNAIQSSPPIFLVVIDLCDECSCIESNLLFWLTFIENQCTHTSGKPHAIIIGSHADILRKISEELIKPKEKVIHSVLDSCNAENIEFAGFITMNCQSPGSREMNELRRQLKVSCDTVRVVDSISFNAHCFFVFLHSNFRKNTAITILDVQAKLAEIENSESKASKLLGFVPTKSVMLISSICIELSDRGHILFLKDRDEIKNSWIIIDKIALLSKVNGTIFAPEGFKQHCQLATGSTGVVPQSKIISHFPNLDYSMLIGLLSHLEFCHQLSDDEVLQLIHEEHQEQPHEKYFLFPALIKVEAPSNRWELSPDCKYHSGWILTCLSKGFYTPRFFEVLLLRLAFSCAFPQKEGEVNEEFPAIQRKCLIWKNGIYWSTRDGDESLVEINEHNNTILFLSRSRELTRSCLELRSTVIQKVMKAAKEFCPLVKTVDYFIDPSEVVQHPLQPRARFVSTTVPSASIHKHENHVELSKLTLFSGVEVATALVEGKPVALSRSGKPLHINTLLTFEPYACIEQQALNEMFVESYKTQSKQLPENFTEQIISKASSDRCEMLKILLKTGSNYYLSPTSMRKEYECMGTYKHLRELLDHYSVFADRNILVSE